MQSDRKIDYIFRLEGVMIIILQLKLYYITTRTMKSGSRLADMGRKERRAEFWWGNLERNTLRNLKFIRDDNTHQRNWTFSRFTSLFLVSGM
jgi:hypothetical protein